MRCKACDRALSDRESTNVCVVTGEHPDLCTGCLQGLGVLVKENPFTSEKPVDPEPLIPGDPFIVAEEDDFEYPNFEEALGG